MSRSDRDITLLGGHLLLKEPAGCLGAGMDAVMLAAACPVRQGESLLDLGCGVGSAGLCVMRRVPDISLTGIDIQETLVEYAALNASQNGFSKQAKFICTDVAECENHKFHHIIMNPPYMGAGKHKPAEREQRALAIGHTAHSLKDWVACAFRNINAQGSLTLIHWADSVDKIIQALGKRFGDMEIIPLWPKRGMPAKRLIIRCHKHKKGSAKLLPGLVLHRDDGEYTREAEQVLTAQKAI